MLRYAALFLIIAMASVLIVFLGNVLSIAIITIAKVCLMISVPLFLVFIIIDLVKRTKKRKV